MGVPYFSQMGHKAEGRRAVGILPPTERERERERERVRENPRERDFTHPCNRWMK